MCSPSFIQVLFQYCPGYTRSSVGARGLDLYFCFLLCFLFLPLPEDCSVLTTCSLQGRASAPLPLPDSPCDTSDCIPYISPSLSLRWRCRSVSAPRPAGLSSFCVPLVPLTGGKLCFKRKAILSAIFKDLKVTYVHK